MTGHAAPGSAIRLARPADLDALEAIEVAAFASDRLSRRALAHAIRSPTILCLALADHGGVRGYALVQLRRGSKRGRITSLALAPDEAGRGLGALLLGGCEAEARAAGCTQIGLEVRADNAAAVRLYEGAGYRFVGTEAGYYEDGEAASRYVKLLG